MEEDPGIIHTNLALLPPLIADNPGDSPKLMNAEEARAREAAIKLMEDSTVYPEIEGPNPHEPIVLSELFTLSDSLWTRFPLEHSEVRAEEVMASRSAIFTYEELEKQLDTGSASATDQTAAHRPNTSSEEIASWVSTGPFNEEDVVVVPAPDDSEDDEPPIPPPVNRKTLKSQNQLRRKLVGRTSLALLVLVLGLSIAAYQARHKRGLSGLWAFPGLFLDRGARGVLFGQAGSIGSWLVSGRIKISEVVEGMKEQVGSLISPK
jgi:hypothetical protein